MVKARHVAKATADAAVVAETETVLLYFHRDLKFNCLGIAVVLYREKLIAKLAGNRVAPYPFLDQFSDHTAFQRDL